MVRLREAAVLVGAAIVCAVVSNLTASPQRRLAWIGRYPDALKVPAPVAPAPPPAPGVASAPAASTFASGEYAPHPDRPWVAITGDQAVELHRKGIPFLDARRTVVYEAGHIAGARSFPIWESTVDDAVKRLFEEGYDVNAPLVVYCSGGDCEDSHMLSQKLHGYGFNNALVYTEGFPDWEKRGLPVEKGAAR
jgi:rhodanese-related sulfurtransferase